MFKESMFRTKVAILDRFKEEDLIDAIIRKRAHDKGEVLSQKDVEELVFQHRDEKRAEIFRASYTSTLSNIIRQAEVEGKEFLDSAIKIVSLDLAYSNLAYFVYLGERSSLDAVMPSFYYDEENIKHTISFTHSEVEVRDCVVVERPYDAGKWARHKRMHKKGELLKPEEFTDALPYYYPSMGIIFQGNNSIHRTAEAFVHDRPGKALVNMADDKPLVEHIATDGAYWLNKHTGKPIGNYLQSVVLDYRLALLFTMKQMEK